jgi:hypothetical protein
VRKTIDFTIWSSVQPAAAAASAAVRVESGIRTTSVSSPAACSAARTRSTDLLTAVPLT